MIQKLSDFAREADLDLQTLLEDQLNDPVLQVVRHGSKLQIQDLRRDAILTNQNPYYHKKIGLNTLLTNMTLTSYAIENHFKTLAKPR